MGAEDDASDWQSTTLGESVVINDSTYTPSENWPFVNYLDTANITDNRIAGIHHLIAGVDDVPSRARRKVRQGDIVYSTVRPNQRHHGVIRDPPMNLLASTGFAVLRGKEGVAKTSFVYRLLTQTHVVDYLQGLAEQSVSAFPAIKVADLESLPIRLPSLPAQTCIADVLDAFDAKIELNRRMAETLEESVRALFKSWFTTNGYVSACEGTLADIASLNSEAWMSATAPDNVAYVDLSNTKWGVIEKIETYAWRDAPSRASRVLRPGNTIVGTVRPGNGSHALVGVEGLTGSTGFVVLRPKESFDTLFVWCAATSKSNIGRLAQLADGGAYPAVSLQAVAATKITLADVATRKRFSALTTPLADRMLAAYGEINRLAGLRDMLLPKLISGGIRIPDVEKIAEVAT